MEMHWSIMNHSYILKNKKTTNKHSHIKNEYMIINGGNHGY